MTISAGIGSKPFLIFETPNVSLKEGETKAIRARLRNNNSADCGPEQFTITHALTSKVNLNVFSFRKICCN